MAKKTNIKREMLVRVYIGFLLIVLLGAGIVGRTFYIQSYKGSYYRAKADSLTIFYKTIRADRGNIYAKDGSLLATSLPIFDLYIDFAADGLTENVFNTNIDSVTLLLSQFFPTKTQEQYKKEFKYNFGKRRRYYPLKRNVTYDELLQLKSFPLFRLGRNKSGLIEESKEIREHPFGQLALRTIGIDENLDGEYSSGLERKYHDQLQGIQGKKLMQKVGAGVTRPLDSKEEIIPQPGRDIYTTIDITIQDVAQEALRENLIHYGAHHGCVVVMETKTGKIRAIANLGRIDSLRYYEAVNYAVTEATEPGSTFKIATVASLMEDGVVDKNTKINCGNGVAVFHGKEIKDHDAPETPLLTLQRAIEVSSNVAVAKLAYNTYGANKQKFYNHLEKFGFSKPIEIELQGVPKPTLAQPKQWSRISPAYIAHGYEIAVTPMHTLQFYNAIANGGVLVRPTLVEKITHFAQIKDSFQLQETKILSDKTVAELRAIMEGVVENGTAMNLKMDYLKIAGKTGTAKIAQGKEGYKKAVYQASFCGYFPAEDPQYSMIVVVSQPSQNGYYGNRVAGGVFRLIADKIYASNLHLHKKQDSENVGTQLPLIVKSTKDDIDNIYQFFGVIPKTDDAEWLKNVGNKKFQEMPVADNVMPDLSGMTLRDALYMVEQMGLLVQFSGKGFVKSQSISAGERVKKGQTVKIELT